jgi:hypothetical protein
MFVSKYRVNRIVNISNKNLSIPSSNSYMLVIRTSTKLRIFSSIRIVLMPKLVKNFIGSYVKNPNNVVSSTTSYINVVVAYGTRRKRKF